MVISKYCLYAFSRLKVEVCVLKELGNEPGFPTLYLYGRTKFRNFMVIENLGPDISRIRRSLPGKRYV